MIPLDIVLTNGFIAIIVLLLLVIAMILGANFSDLKKENKKFRGKEIEYEVGLKENQFQFQQQLAERNAQWSKEFNDLKTSYFTTNTELRNNINKLAQEMFEKMKSTELQSYIVLIRKQENDAALLLLAQWKVQSEEQIRKDAVTRSMGVNLGKITEHLIPFSELFKELNPRDARFIGSPIDLIVFDGLSDHKPQINIYFVEVKSGSGNLSPKQKKVRDAIAADRVYWLPMNAGNFNWEYDGENDEKETEQDEAGT